MENIDYNSFNSLKEEDVGITEYIYLENTGFNCVLKHRYSDFLVNEIDIDGNVVWLKTNTNNLIIKAEDQAEAKESSGNPVLDEQQIDNILNNHFKNVIENEEDFQNFRKYLNKYVNKELNNDDKIKINFILEKEKRKFLHENIREYFSFLDSETEMQTKDKVLQNLPEYKKMVIFISPSHTNFHKRRKVFPDVTKKYLHFSLLKRNMDTIQTISYISRQIHRSNKSIKFAGNKDKRGITTQSVSVFNTLPDEITNVTKSKHFDKRIEIGNFSYKDYDLRLGLLKGNQFCVVFRFLAEKEETNLNLIKNNIVSLETQGFINYFGLQRFGVCAIPTHKIGIHVIKKNWKEAVLSILNSSSVKEALCNTKMINYSDKVTNEQLEKILDDEDNINKILKHIPRYKQENKMLICLRKSRNGYYNAFKCLPKQLQVLYPHAYQSYIWNTAVSERIKKFKTQILIGDIVKKNTGTTILEDNEIADDVGEDLANVIEEDENIEENEIQSQVEIDSDKIFYEGFEYITQENINKYSINDVVIPLVGSKVKYPQNETKDYILNLLNLDNLTIDEFNHQKVNFNATGFFRKIIEKPTNVKYSFVWHDKQDVDLQNEHYNIMDHPTPPSVDNKYLSLRLQFQLPQSTYATMLFRELTKKSSSVSYQMNLSKNMK